MLPESLITPNHFALLFCADLGLEAPYIEQIANQIRAQLEEHGATAALDLPVNTEREGEFLHEDDAGPGDCRVVLQIDVQIGTKHMLDHIEWDLRASLTPEEFTAQFCAEVGLASEAIPMIAHAIHEELLKHKKDVIEWGVLEGGGEWKSHAAGLGNAWGRKGKGPKRMKGIWRDWADIVSGDYAPRIEELTAEELEKKELERERAARYVVVYPSAFGLANTSLVSQAATTRNKQISRRWDSNPQAEIACLTGHCTTIASYHHSQECMRCRGYGFSGVRIMQLIISNLGCNEGVRAILRQR
jgi:chromatin structure-remodeling complex subunit SFH1